MKDKSQEKERVFMQPTNEIKDKETKEENKDFDKEADMELTEGELENVAGGHTGTMMQGRYADKTHFEMV